MAKSRFIRGLFTRFAISAEMGDHLTKSEPESHRDGGAAASLRARQYEIIFRMTTEILATRSLDERMLLALDTITSYLGFPNAAIALIDGKRGTLRMRLAVGFEDNSAIERIEMPLDSAAVGVSVVHEARPAWISRGGNEYSPFISKLATDSDVLALPLFGGQWRRNAEGDLALRHLSEETYWLPRTMCIGALYVGVDRRAADEATLDLLTRCADPIGLAIAAALEIEEMTAAVRTLRRERQWVESIMKSVADPIVLTNLDNEILLQNRRAEDLFSGSEDASEGKRRALKLNDLLFSAYLSSAAVSSTEVLGRDLTLVDPIEGTDIHFEVISTPALNEQGERIGLVSVFRDVTDLRKANEELARNYAKLQQAEADARRERDRLNRIIENVGHPIVVTDTGGNFILFNRRAELLFEQADPSAERALAAVRANSVKLTSFISGLAWETLGGRKAEIELIDPETGESLPMEITSVEVRDARGQVTAVVSILHDLAEIRELERRRVEQKLFESEKLAAVGTLAASIAHEVNNPLEAIKNSLFLLQSKKDEASNASFLSIALKETERVSHIIRQMLGFARRSGGVEWVNVNNLLEDTLALVEKKLHHSGIRVLRQMDRNLPAVHSYPDQLRQVFLNLVLNAQQAIEGAGSITVRTSQMEGMPQPSIAVEIIDTGCGISDEDMARIFEPFFSMRKDGTGLGLWVTQNIVRQHGGRIDVRSSEKGGTSFKVILPVDSPALMSVAKD
ncbi:MAG TPA: ATP-binding protein [Blastocatellia bacterium]|nr:ATP-binding protein [Blastocatellia bacterium]